jgi:alpha,alpha-trehalase
MPNRARSILLAVLLFAGVGARAGAAEPPPPSVVFQELYSRVETERLFADSKTFADAVPKEAPSAILSEYRAHPPSTRAELEAFVAARFTAPPSPAGAASASDAGLVPLKAHIAAIWPRLMRSPQAPQPYSSELPLAHPYVVPGGRFREIYYWDSYFTMLGLMGDGHRDTTAAMTQDFADLIDRYGHVPNGSRTYYLSRSQPPVFYLMVGLTADGPDDAFARYLPELRREYAYWMQGATGLAPGRAVAHAVAMPDGAILNRYWDALDTPRDESFREDTALAATTPRPAADLYRDLRAAAESGWDFSSRWFADSRSLASIETTSIVPVDLNALLFGLERAIARGCARAGDKACATGFEARAVRRRAAMDKYLWDRRSRTFQDYDWRVGAQTARPSAAMLFPLFVGEASRDQAAGVASYVRAHLLAEGGVLATPRRTGQQWDSPNGWAPLQWAAVSGLNAYGHRDLARLIAKRWLRTVSRVYAATGKMLEKYDVESAKPGGGGEYPLQDGFGWTNGVTRALLGLYPDLSQTPPARAATARAGAPGRLAAAQR